MQEHKSQSPGRNVTLSLSYRTDTYINYTCISIMPATRVCHSEVNCGRHQQTDDSYDFIS